MPSLPRGAERARCAWISAAFALLFGSVYGAADRLTSLHTLRLHVHLPFEPGLPFVPELAGVYLSLGLLFAFAPFVLPSWRELLPLAITLAAETTVAGVCFLLLPVELGYLPPARGTELFALADALNLEHNALPSLHVAFATTLAAVLGSRLGRGAAWGFGLWAAGIAAAAVLIHAHHLLDVLAGALLALAAVRLVYPRASAPALLDVVRVEWICLREFAHFTTRHARYAVLFAVLYGRSLPRWRELRAVRAGYCLLQHLDDIADGDREIRGEPAAYLRAALREIESGHFARDTVASVLAADVVPALRRRAIGGVDAVRDLAELIGVLILDRERAAQGRVWTEPELRAHHRKTFALSLSLTLTAVGSDLTAKDAEPLIEALGWCSPTRDLAEDLARGLVNIPAEVLAAAGGAVSREHAARLLAEPAVQCWIETEQRRGVAALDAFDRAWPRIAKRRGAGALRLLHRALRSYAARVRLRSPTARCARRGSARLRSPTARCARRGSARLRSPTARCARRGACSVKPSC